jgi:tetratricopeptide (TPR) repeat protein
MLMLAAIAVFAQVHTTVPPTQGKMPRPDQDALRQVRVGGLEQEGDLHYLRRADGRTDDVAGDKEIDAALDAYKQAMDQEKKNVSPRWKYLRATYFKAEFTGQSADAKAALYERALPVSDEAIALEKEIAGRRGGRPPESLEPDETGKALHGDKTAGEVFFWSSVVWGQWSLVHGKFAAIKEGAAARIRDESRTVIAIDPQLEDGGGYRVLGRLHSEAPKVPFLTGWIDRQEAIRDLRKAVEIAPDNLVNLLFLAEALHEHSDMDGEARGLLEKVSAATPHPDHLVEDLRAQSIARRHLANWPVP